MLRWFLRNTIRTLLFAGGLCALPACAANDAVPDWVHAAIAMPLPTLPVDARAVVLLDETVFTVGADGKAVEHRRRVIKILRPSGRDEGIVSVGFDNDTKLLSLHVWSVGPGGQEYTVKDKEIIEVGATSEGGKLFEDVRYKVATPAGRDPGGYIAYEYEQRQPAYQKEVDWFIQTDLPRLHQSFQLELPPGYAYAAHWAHHEPVPARDLEHATTRWDLASSEMIDLNHVPMAPGMKGLMGRMAIQYGPASQTPALGTWKQVGNWYDQLSRDRMVATPEIAAKAADLTAGKTDFYEKAEAIAEFVQKDIRYFVIEKGIGGQQPHAAADIFRNRYGDCKDKSTLMAAMFQSVGLRSIMVLVDTTRGFIDPAAPSMYGNHAIAAIEIPAGYESSKLRSVVTAHDGKRYLIADPTWEKTPFGQLEATLQGGYGVLVEGPESEVVQFPVLSPEMNTVTRAAKFELSADGILRGDVVESRFGDQSELVRELYAYGNEKQRQTYFDKQMGHDLTSFAASNRKVTNLEALNKPVTTTFNLAAEHYGRSMGSLIMIRPRVLGSEGMVLDHEPRVYPIDLGETLQATDNYTIQLPENLVVDELPEPVKLDVGFASYESQTRADGNLLHYTRTYTVRAVSIPADRYSDLQRLASTIESDEQSHAVFKKK